MKLTRAYPSAIATVTVYEASSLPEIFGNDRQISGRTLLL